MYTKLLSSLFILFICFTVNAQWTLTSGPGVSGTENFFFKDGILYVGTLTDGVYKSTDNGNIWIPANSGIENTDIKAITGNNNYLFASRNDGTSFNFGGVYRSSNEGNSWQPANSGIENQLILSLLADADNIYAGSTGQGIFKSTDNGSTWVSSGNGMGLESVRAIVKNGSNLLASGDNNLYYSPDEGSNWYWTNGGQFFGIFSLYTSGNYMYAGGWQGLIKSTDGGLTWGDIIWLDYLLGYEHITAFSYIGSILYASTSGNAGVGVIKSTDNGDTWSLANNGIAGVDVTNLFYWGSKLFSATAGKGVMSSSNGFEWVKSNSGLPPGGIVRKLLNYNGSILAGTGWDGIYKSDDHGLTWNKLNPNGPLENETVLSLESKDNILFAGTGFNGPFRSFDGGSNWEPITNGLPAEQYVTLALQATDNYILAGTGDALYYSSDYGTNWLPTNITDAAIWGMAYAGGYVYAIANTGFFNTSGIYRSTNSGISWSLVLQSSISDPISIAAKDNFVYVGDLISYGISISDDYGINWPYGGLGGYGVYSILPLQDSVYVGISDDPLTLKSDVYGVNWSAINQGLEPPLHIESFTYDNFYIYGGSPEKGVWIRPRYDIIPVELLSFTAENFEGNVTLKWSTASEKNNRGFEIERLQDYKIRILQDWENIGFVEGKGTTTEQQEYSFIDKNITSGKYFYRLKQLDFDGKFEYLPTGQAGSNEIEVDVAVPLSFSLEQNYPNPFNPSTKISYSIPHKSFVTLKVYDPLGSIVSELVGEEKEAGRYELDFNAVDLPSGVYFYKIEAGEFVETKKMILLK